MPSPGVLCVQLRHEQLFSYFKKYLVWCHCHAIARVRLCTAYAALYYFIRISLACLNIFPLVQIISSEIMVYVIS